MIDPKKLAEQQKHSLKGLKGAPSQWLQRFSPLYVKGGNVLDFACGCGRNDRYLSSLGMNVTASDIDERVYPYLEDILGLKFILTDLEDAPWPFEKESFDLIVVNFYLYRPRLKDLASLLKPGGYLVYETFMRPYPEFDGNRARNDDFNLKPLELPDTFRDILSTVAYEETLGEGTDCFQRYIGRKFIKGLNQPVRIINF